MSTNPTFKPSEGKREEFRKYLEKNGVMDALTKVLVNLYEEPEKPEDALEYIRDRLAMQAGLETHNQIKGKLEETEGKVQQLEQALEELKASLEPPPAGDPEEKEEAPAAEHPEGEEHEAKEHAEEEKPAEETPNAAENAEQ